MAIKVARPPRRARGGRARLAHSTTTAVQVGAAVTVAAKHAVLLCWMSTLARRWVAFPCPVALIERGAHDASATVAAARVQLDACVARGTAHAAAANTCRTGRVVRSYRIRTQPVRSFARTGCVACIYRRAHDIRTPITAVAGDRGIGSSVAFYW